MNIPIISSLKTNPYTHPGDLIDDIDKKELQGTKVTFQFTNSRTGDS